MKCAGKVADSGLMTVTEVVAQSGRGVPERTMGLPKVIISHGGVQYSYQLALALQELGCLERFFTTFCYTQGYLQEHLVRTLPVSLRQKVDSYFSRRMPRGVEAKRLWPIGWPELLHRASILLLGRNYFTSHRLQEWQSRLFDASVARKLGEHDFAVLIALSGSSLQTVAEAKRLGRVVVLDQHDIHCRAASQLLREEMTASPEFADTVPCWPPLESYLEMVEKEIELADYIVVPSTFALRTHLEAGVPEGKLVLMPHATEPAYESLPRERRPDGKFRVLFVGSITQRKGVKYLLEAIRRLNRGDIELVMVGPKVGSLEPIREYREYARWVPYVDHDKLRDYFNEADVFVLPTIYDAFGLSALEAMAAGLPVIVSENCVAGSDVVRDGTDGFVVPIRDPDAIRQRLEELMADDERRTWMGENARERVKEFNWASYARRWRHFLGSLQMRAV